MDYHSMKRKELQALCKKHNIPASSANSVLADKLSELLNEKRKPTTRQRTCMKSLIETKEDDESGVSKRQEKKVRFSPDNELVEYELRSGKKQMAARRKCLPQKVEKPVVDDAVQIPVKLTRSRVQLVEQDRKTVKDIVKRTNVVKEPEVNHGKVTRSKVHKLGKRGADELENASETVGEPVVSRVRVTRSKAQTPIDDVKDSDVKLEFKKNSGKRAAKDVKIVEPVKESFDIPVRVTRSRGQPLKDDYEKSHKTVNNPQNEKKRTRRELKATDQTSSSNNVSPKRRSLRAKRVENVDENEDEKVEVVNGRKGTRSKAHLATRSSGRNSKNQADDEVVKIEENVGRKNVNRRKAVVQSEKTETVVHLEESVNRRDTRRQTVGKKQSKGQSGNLSMIGEDLEDPITVHVSPVFESSKRSTRSGGKTEGKMVKNSAKEQLESSPKKRAKLGDNSANINKTPVSKLVNDGKVSESEVTPVINKRFTRSAIKEQDAMLSSHKVGKFKHDPAVNTAPVRVTRTGVKQYAARNLSERVDKKKQLTKSSGPESDNLSTKGAEENRVSLFEENGSGDSESNDKVKDVDQNPPDFPNLEDETAETNGEASLEAVPDAIPDVQNQVVNENSATCNEDSEKLDSENDEEPLVSVAVEESVGNTDLGKSKEIEDPVDPPIIEEDGNHEVTASEGGDQTVETVCVSPVVESSKRSGPESDGLFVVENRVSVLEGLFEENESDDKVKDAEQNPPDFPNLEDETNAEHAVVPDVQNQVVNENFATFNEDEVEVAVVNSEKLEEKVELKNSENDEELLVSVGKTEGSVGNAREIEDPVDLPIIEEDGKHEVSASEGEGNKDDVLEQLIDDQPNKEEQLADINEYNDVVTDNNEHDNDNDEDVLGKSETDSMPFNDENLVLSGTVDANEEQEKSSTNNETEIDINIDSLGQHSELSTGKNDVADLDEIPILDQVDDEEGSEQDALNFKNSPLTDKPEVADINEHDDEHVLGKSGTDSMPSDGENLVLSGAVNTNEKALTNIGADMDSSNANDTLDPLQNENVPVVTQVLITQSNHEPQPEPEPEIGAEPEVEPVAEPETKLESKQEPEAAAEPEYEAEPMPVVSVDSIACDTNVGVCHDSIPHDAVSSIFGDILTDDDQKVSENYMSNEDMPVETDNDHVSNDEKEPLATLDHGLDDAYADLDYPLVENINTQENPTPTKQECTFDGPVSSQLMGDDESPITKERSPLTYGKAEKSIEVETFTEETEKATTSLDWGNYDDTFQKPVSPNENNDESNEFQKSVSANENNDESDEFQKLDDQSNEFHVADENDDQSTKAEGISDPSIEESCSPAVDFVKSAKKLEQSPRNVVVDDVMKNNVKLTEDLLDDWSDSAIKSLFITPGVGHVKEGGRNKTPAHGENESSNAGSAQISGVKDSQMSFTFTSDIEHGTAANEFNRQSAANDTPTLGSTQISDKEHGTAAKEFRANESSTCENEIPNFEHFSGKLFGDDHYYGMSNEAATGDDDASRLKVIEKKEEEIQLRGSDDDLADF